MAEITVKLFGVFRTDTHLAAEKINVDSIADIFPSLNERSLAVWEEKKKTAPSLEKPAPVKFKDAVVYINGERVKRKSSKVKDGDEIWVMSPASGG